MEQAKEAVNVKTGEIVPMGLDMERWQVMRQQADVLVKSGFLPVAINTPEKALAVMQKGRELGIGPMEAFSSINIIQGKISVSPQLMLALARRTKELEDFDLQKDDKEAVVTVKRLGQKPVITRFGIKEATAQGLFGKDNYKKQPAIMFQWRALAENLRLTFGDAISGMYTADELGLEMGEDGTTRTVTTKGTVSMPRAIEKGQPLPIETEVAKP